MAAKAKIAGNSRPCWEMRGCSLKTRTACPAWEFQLGHICWFINGTICQGSPAENGAKNGNLQKMPGFSFVCKNGLTLFQDERSEGPSLKEVGNG